MFLYICMFLQSHNVLWLCLCFNNETERLAVKGHEVSILDSDKLTYMIPLFRNNHHQKRARLFFSSISWPLRLTLVLLEVHSERIKSDSPIPPNVKEILLPAQVTAVFQYCIPSSCYFWERKRFNTIKMYAKKRKKIKVLNSMPKFVFP